MRLDPAVAGCRSAVRAGLRDLDRGGLVLVACSGGADSLALAAAALWEAPRCGLCVGVVTVDHGLQAGSASRAAAVVRWAGTAGADPAEVITTTERAGARGGPEASARGARYAALDAAAERHGAAAVLLGHTLDDQAETVLLGLARGSGARSLAGMPAVRGRYRRPFLRVPRAVTDAACRALGLEPWRDPHNADPAFARARVRSVALPVLEAALGPGIAAALARTADLLRADADALDTWARQALAEVRGADGTLHVAALGALPDAVRTRVLRTAVLSAGVPAGRLSAEHVRALDALVTDWHGQGAVALPGGYRLARRDRLLHLSSDHGGEEH